MPTVHEEYGFITEISTDIKLRNYLNASFAPLHSISLDTLL
jgi:hypothetical protein